MDQMSIRAPGMRQGSASLRGCKLCRCFSKMRYSQRERKASHLLDAEAVKACCVLLINALQQPKPEGDPSDERVAALDTHSFAKPWPPTPEPRRCHDTIRRKQSMRSCMHVRSTKELRWLPRESTWHPPRMTAARRFGRQMSHGGWTYCKTVLVRWQTAWLYDIDAVLNTVMSSYVLIENAIVGITTLCDSVQQRCKQAPKKIACRSTISRQFPGSLTDRTTVEHP